MPEKFKSKYRIASTRLRNWDYGAKASYFVTICTQNNQPQPSSPTNENPPCNRFGPQSQNLTSIIRGFKIGVTKQARLAEPRFAWQSRFHDHIIRNEGSYHRISEYIINNPKNWAEDMFNKT